MIISNFLKQESYKLEVAVNGKEAIEKALERAEFSEEGFYDGILMDYDMPVMNGHEATIELRKLMKEGKIP